MYITLFYCRNATLREVIKNRGRLTEMETKYYLRQIVNGLIYLREHNVIHRDLKLGNLFIDDQMQIQIGDFGLCAKLKERHQRRKSLLGTPNYLAPEVLDEERWNGHGFEVDVWGIGICIYMMLIGKLPFDAQDTKVIY